MIGESAVSKACRIHLSIERHRELFREIAKTMKTEVKKQAGGHQQVHVPQARILEDQAQVSVRSPTNHRVRHTRDHRPRGGLVHGRLREGGEHGSKPTATATPAEGLPLVEAMAQAKKRANKSLVRKQHGARIDGDVIGGFRSTEDEQLTPEQRLTVCTLNVAGMDEVKLDMVLQHIEEMGIDVMFCIDAQLSAKAGRFLGRKAKARLGTGTVVHITPCAVYGAGQGTGFNHRKVGGIMTIVNTRWGTSIKDFAPDWLGVKGTPAGVLSRLTLCTTDGDICIIGSYWPISHAKADDSDKNLWKLLQGYIDKHGDKDKNPTELVKRMVHQWVQTAVKNGANGAILTGDLNSTWGAGESGGQQAIRHWAGEHSFINGPLQIGGKLNCKFVTRGNEAGKGSWIDHILHKGRRAFIDSIAAYTDHGVHWEGITDHRPHWTTYLVPPAMEKVPQKQHREQIRWELPLTDRRLRDAFIEGMEAIHTRHPPPGAQATIADCLSYVAETERRSGALVKNVMCVSGLARRGALTKMDGVRDIWATKHNWALWWKSVGT